ncbi:MAG TPA: peptidase [Nitrospiraceae bacterium]|jgi:serine protease Do|nr:peptidase [Nitrospiraceae bacterium]
MKKKPVTRVLVALVLAVVMLGLGYGISTAVKVSDPPVSQPLRADTPMIPGNFSELAERARPAVVNIQTVKTIQGGSRVLRHFFGNPFQEQNPFEEFFGLRPQGYSPDALEQRSLGSGFIIDRDGYIVTNNHVVENADQIKVKLFDSKEFDARVVGRDPKTDLALIKIDGASGLQPIAMGNSDELKVGNWVVAIGSPFGLEQTVTAGIVSAKSRVIGSGPYDNFIQTDASINPGNSGGPLINMRGEVVAINTAIIASGKGIGFAIPVNMAKEVLPQLKDNGKVVRAWLGVGIQEMTEPLAQSFGLKEKKGALVTQVFKDSPAEQAGIAQGDVLVEFNGKAIGDSHDLPSAVAAMAVGKTVTIKLLRNGTTITKQVKLGTLEEKTEVAKTPSHKMLGIMIQNITPELARTLGLANETGVVVSRVEPDSPADNAGLQRGDVIQEVNRHPVKDTQDFLHKIEEAKDGGNLLLLVHREEGNLFVAVTAK